MRDKKKDTGKRDTIVVVGNSMYPTLKPLDIASVTPCRASEVQVGDILVFPSPKNNTKIIHRVVAVTREGYVTRGDNSRHIDNWLVNPGIVCGKVESLRRNARQLRVRSGSQGHLIGQYRFVILNIVHAIKRILYPVYRLLWRSGIFRLYMPKPFRPKVLAFKRPEGTEFHLVMGRKVIGRRSPTSTGWYIRPPYRLFVDEATLVKTVGHQASPAIFSVEANDRDHK